MKMPCEYEDCEWMLDELFGTFGALAGTLNKIADMLRPLDGIERVITVRGVFLGRLSFDEAVEKLKKITDVIIVGFQVAIVKGATDDHFYIVMKRGMGLNGFKVPISVVKELVTFSRWNYG